MLQVPRLDGDDFRSIFERARARIPTLTEEWTNFNPSDPGITTLETFAWLFDTLHYYMNASGEVHRLKYFKLLGIEPRQHRAKCVLALAGGDVDVPRGARVWAGDVPFETLESFHGPANGLTGVCLEQEGRLRDLTGQAGVDGGFADLFGPDCAPGACLYLGFARPLEGRVRLYLELQQTPRNPFGPGFSLAKLAWDAFDGRWTEAAVEEDETCGLLRSGFVTLRLHRAQGGPEGLPPGCYVRCRLVENNYDLAPPAGPGAALLRACGPGALLGPCRGVCQRRHAGFGTGLLGRREPPDRRVCAGRRGRGVHRLESAGPARERTGAGGADGFRPAAAAL